MKRRDQRGLILMVVLVFALLLVSSIATFTRRAVVDTAIARNRDHRAQAEALARGGIEIGKALLLHDLQQADGEGGLDTEDDLWARIGGQEIVTAQGSGLRIRIQDAGQRLNINAVVGGQGEDGRAESNAEDMLGEMLEKVIDEMNIPPGEKVYDQADLVGNLIDWVDGDEERVRGGHEEDVYDLRKHGRTGPPNRPLLSLDELREIDGYDAKLVDALRPYLTVYPYAGTTGVNLNTAPPHVLSLLFFDDGVSLVLAPENTVRDILRVRQDGGLVCDQDQSDEACTPIGEIVTTNTIFPPPSYESHVFTIVAEARVGDVERSVEAVVDRSQAPTLLLLSWRVL